MDFPIPLSRYLAQAGFCSRRQAVLYIKNGTVTVNGQIVTNPAHRVERTDTVRCRGALVHEEPEYYYIVLNKPRGYITSVKDERGRKTVMDLVDASLPRVYPVGRLDRDTTGVLLLTNDGYLTHRLSHPRFKVPKKYFVTLDRPLKSVDAGTLQNGIHIDDSLVTVDRLVYKSEKSVYVTLHSGKYRVIRRMFQKLSYTVTKLDRVSYADITKHGLKRGEWRYLTPEEIASLYTYFKK